VFRVLDYSGTLHMQSRPPLSSTRHRPECALLSSCLTFADQFCSEDRTEQLNHRERREPKEIQAVGQSGMIPSRVRAVLSQAPAHCVLCALCGWRTPVYGIKDAGKGGCRRFHGFRRSRVAGPNCCWSLLLPNGSNLAHSKMPIVDRPREVRALLRDGPERGAKTRASWLI